LTTIAYKDGVMAADTMEIFHETKYYGVNKIDIGENSLFGYAGPVQFMPKVMLWWQRSETTVLSPPAWDCSAVEDCSGFYAILVRRGKDYHPPTRQQKTPHEIYGVTDGGVAIIFPGKDQCIAIGSGAPFALGAMHAGADAIDGVKAAIKYDLCTGGAVQTVSFA